MFTTSSIQEASDKPSVHDSCRWSLPAMSCASSILLLLVCCGYQTSGKDAPPLSAVTVPGKGYVNGKPGTAW